MIIQIEDNNLDELPMFSMWEMIEIVSSSSLGKSKNKSEIIFYLIHYAEEKGYSEFSLNDLQKFTEDSIGEIKKELLRLRKLKYIQFYSSLKCFEEKIKFYILKFSTLMISNKKKAFLALEWQRQFKQEMNKK